MSLNPSAPSFAVNDTQARSIIPNQPSSPSSTDTTLASSTASSTATYVENDSRYAAALCPGGKLPDHPSTFKNTRDPSPEDKASKVATRLGEGWVSNLPVFHPTTASRTASTTGLLHTHNKGCDNLSFEHTRRSRSPSVPFLPSDDIRRGAIAVTQYDSRQTEQLRSALQHLTVAPRTKPIGHERSSPAHLQQLFNPFSDGEGFAPIDASPRAALLHQRSSPNLSTALRTGSRRMTNTTSVRFAPLFEPLNEERSVLLDDNLAPATYSTSELGQGRNVYIPDFGTEVSEDGLYKLAQEFGRVICVKVERNGLATMTPDIREMLPDGVTTKGERIYAFVMFDSRQAAANFMRYLQTGGVPCQYGKETPHLVQKTLEDPFSSNLYVAEIPLTATEDDMTALFHPAQISSFRFLTDNMGNRRGTAMVRLQSRAQAEDAIMRLDRNITMLGCSKPLQVRIADSENQKQLKKHFGGPRSVDERSEPSQFLHQSAGLCVKASTAPHSSLRTSYSSSNLDTDALLDQIACAEAELQRRRSQEAMGRSHLITPRTSSVDERSSGARTHRYTASNASFDSIQTPTTTSMWNSQIRESTSFFPTFCTNYTPSTTVTPATSSVSRWNQAPVQAPAPRRQMSHSSFSQLNSAALNSSTNCSSTSRLQHARSTPDLADDSSRLWLLRD